MVKKIVAIVLIVLTGGAWIYLDYENKQEILAAEEMRKAMIEMRAQAQARAAAKAKFEGQIQAELASCKATADKSKEDFMMAHQKPVKHKQGQFTMSQQDMDEATKSYDAANAACQSAYDKHLQTGT